VPAEPEPTRYLLAWLDSKTSIMSPTLDPIRRAIEDQVQEPREQVAIDVWLESPGGDAHAAYKLALMLRDAATSVRVVIPDYAKSAASLLTLAGNCIYMAPGAELGPLDAQMPEEGSLVGQISALNIARAADDVARNAVQIALRGGAEVLQLTGLSRADTMEVMFRFSADFSEPLVKQLDPRVVHDAKQMLNVTVKYAERLLTMTGCKGASRIAKAMVENYPTHGFVIDLTEAQTLGLPAFPIREYEFWEQARDLHRLTEGAEGLIKFGRIDEFVSKEDEDLGGEATDGSRGHGQAARNGDPAPADDGTPGSSRAGTKA
jgi:hypothetical protein